MNFPHITKHHYEIHWYCKYHDKIRVGLLQTILFDFCKHFVLLLLEIHKAPTPDGSALHTVWAV